MNNITIIKIAIDFIMTMLLLFLMAHMLTGQEAHEWFGTTMFVLFIIHNVLNFKWYKNLLKGRYSAFRIFQTAVNLLVLISMIGQMVSGIMMSRHVFAFLSISNGMSLARQVHMLGSYWGFILMSIHFGLHWNRIMGMMKNAVKASPSDARKVILRVIVATIAAYGVYAFLKHDIASYLFLKTEFAFFDLEQSLILFYADYLAMMGLWVIIAYYAAKGLQWISSRKKRGAEIAIRISTDKA